MKIYTFYAITSAMLLASLQIPVMADARAVEDPNEHAALITLSRSHCYGTCPVYTVEIYDDGKVKYSGQSYVKHHGIAYSTISIDELARLKMLFDKLNFFSLKPGYTEKNCPQYMTDNSSAAISLRKDERPFLVEHYHGCRGIAVLDELTKLEDQIDKAVNIEQWIGTESEREALTKKHGRRSEW